jgi:hypothetical protein
MLSKKFSLLLIFSIVITLGLSISLGSLLAAWTSPSVTPPDGNVAAPINISTTGQAKQAGLILNTGNITANGLIVQYGNVGIGILSPAAKLDVAGNIIASTPIANNHLTTKLYVDNAVAAAGSGGGAGTYMMGNSSQVYACFARDICDGLGNYHICGPDEWIGRSPDPDHWVSNINVAIGGWVDTGTNSYDSGSAAPDCGGYSASNCWFAAGRYGTTIEFSITDGWKYYKRDCYSGNRPPLCCSD